MHLFHSLEIAVYAAPFCEALGEPDADRMNVDKAARMPESWSPAFVGVFRGRLGSPAPLLRIRLWHDFGSGPNPVRTVPEFCRAVRIVFNAS